MANDFIAYVHKRRTELQKELDALAAAEAAYHSSTSINVSAAGGVGAQTLPSLTQQAHGHTFGGPWPHTIKEMVIQALREVHPRGLTAMQILEQITERWKPDLRRESLSPQLTRLKNDNLIRNEKRIWKLAEEPPKEAEVPAETGTSETGGNPGIV